ncbi:5'-methylthioadenosine/S-adenosylhomocysteine nucleosidase [Acholeplasma vituli]|uniref:adenosylhomocysteine nucleosidase n=1 Tax=Paracholeplasma vituli TaxID=69473 RepID=A0ABT2PXP7_9MOLU|nr:5'-methylthioadenosine/S-adenosylhomocysteine nucleosidase [Paracholeplasma vituli]MCU0105735.1 5'-methylthioadenosine/S-adenosylhomocysteine nucleosidase [Paracholeplasma vituli]
MILIIGAMASETEAITHLVKDPDNFTLNGKNAVTGEINGHSVMILTTGVGKVNAAFGITSVLSSYDVDYVINIGLVGGFKPLTSGEMVFVDEALYHDFDLSIFGYQKGQVPNLPEVFKPDPAQALMVKEKMNIKGVKLYTGDTFMTEVIEPNTICDMEGAAYFQVSHLLNTKIISIKIVSDIVGEPSQLDDYSAFESACSLRFKSLIDQLLS